MPATPRRTVLCIDDNYALLRMEKTLLEANGFNVLLASSGEQGLALIEAEPVDVVVLDYQMPEMDGAQVAAAIKQKRPEVAILMFSGYPEQVARRSPAVDAFLDKATSSTSALVSAVEDLLAATTLKRAEKRRFPRFPVQFPFVVKRERTGASMVLQGFTRSVGEGGIGGELDGELEPGELVSMQLKLAAAIVRPRAQVRYRNGLLHGFEFLGLSALQQSEIRRCCRQLGRA